VSDFAVLDLIEIFFDQEGFADNAGKAFEYAFVETQKHIEEKTREFKQKGAAAARGGADSVWSLDASSSGSTCTMAFHNFETDKLTIAHVGDSRGVVYVGSKAYVLTMGVHLAQDTIQTADRDKKFGKKMADEMNADPSIKDNVVTIHHATEDHKPDLPNEKARIEAAGGRVVFDGYYNYRVFAKKGMYPGLNMSRALGDTVAHAEAGLTAQPELKEIDVKELRKKNLPITLVIASDGVWEFIDSKKAPGVITEEHGLKDDKGKKGKIGWADMKVNQENVSRLATQSWESWMADSDNEISDDISVIASIL